MPGMAFGLCHDHQSDSEKNEILNGDDDSDDDLTPKALAAALTRVLARIKLTRRNVYADGNEKRIVPFKTVYDVIQQAVSGKDKVESFCIRILKQLDYGLAECQALVLASTRELARLIAEFMDVLGEHVDVKVCACVSSKRNSIRKNQQSLSSGVHVVVGTPRRVLHLLTRRSLRPDHIKVFLLDEADQLLSCDYKDQIYDIFHHLPSKVQPCLYLATLNPEALEIMRNFVRKPVRIVAKRDELEGMKQFYVIVEKETWKFEILCDINRTLALSKSVIFVRSPRYVDWLADKMRSRGLTVSATHEYMDQNERGINVRDFELGSSRVLITTTSLLVSAFYLQKVSVVLNYDLPVDRHLAKWRHGRFGREGVVIDFLTTVDEEERFTDTQIHYNVVVLDLELSSNLP